MKTVQRGDVGADDGGGNGDDGRDDGHGDGDDCGSGGDDDNDGDDGGDDGSSDDGQMRVTGRYFGKTFQFLASLSTLFITNNTLDLVSSCINMSWIKHTMNC